MTGIVGIEELGRRIRKVRVERRLTLKQVEQSSGLSATHLSEIERGRTSPTIGALVRIARALEMETAYFIEAEERANVVHVPRERAREVQRGGGAQIECLTTGLPGSGIFAYRLALAAGGTQEFAIAPEDLPGDAIYYVRRGALHSELGGTTLKLSEGDCVQASSLAGHRLSAAEGAPTEVIAVLTRSLEEA